MNKMRYLEKLLEDNGISYLSDKEFEELYPNYDKQILKKEDFNNDC